MTVTDSALQPPPASADAALQRLLAQAAQGRLVLTELLDQATSLGQQGRTDAVLQLYETWLHHTDSPHRFVVCFNLGTVLGTLNRHAEAEQAYRQALEAKPDFMQAHLNLGHQLEHQGRIEEALACWRTVLKLFEAAPQSDPELQLHALNNLARTLEQHKRYDEAQAYMERSLAVRSDQPKVLQHYVHIRQKQCAWPADLPPPGVSRHQLLMATSPLAMLSASDDPALQLLAAKQFIHERVPPAGPALPARTQRRPGRIRIGYLSSDLCLHAVGLLTAELFELHDRSRFEVYGFCWTREDGSALRRRLIAAMDHHIRIDRLDDRAAAELIRLHDIDILVDLHGLTSGARPGILQLRPAPLQVSYLGFPGTSAVPGVDWVLCDRYVVPEPLTPFMTEKPLYLPRCYQVSDRKREVAPTPKRADYGLPEDRFVYCSFNNNFKFTEELFSLWMRVLAQVPGSVLWLLADNPWAKENMLRKAEACGIERERLIFAPRVSPAEYLARFKLADLFLDTFPYNAGTTASDVLWMGTPLLTLSGRTFISRMAGSLLSNAGLPDLVTTSLQEYERRAVELGRQPQRIASYKRYLAEHSASSPLFDIPGLVKDLEDTLASVVVG
ncbi:tetratricopeptide repeat protein [Aquabacterium sp. A7-Y]|uniref:O-linked N-acetylglucosamine transferase, SPINDLY family protein n=1 Tax=Aquabacterium sp. A7-Y TaxID=1349605 RepID=UPI00223E28FA|nr:tetratricopeptide repeat protein [Aquabacterium sp. A7-Y]MCW7541853.1 tetratricopeptide repeat protein [Aquabacterium sp. A7-Y]